MTTTSQNIDEQVSRDIFYVKMSLFEAREKLKTDDKIYGVIYKGTGEKFRLSTKNLPDRTIIRFWQKAGRNNFHFTNNMGRWNKSANKISRYDW